MLLRRLLVSAAVVGSWPLAAPLDLFVDKHAAAARDQQQHAGPLGSRHRPFSTVAEAVAAIRALPPRTRCAAPGVRVTIKGGAYGGAANMLRLDAGDSGCAPDAPVVYRADPSDPVPVQLHGGVEVPPHTFRWAGTAGGHAVYRADLHSIGLGSLGASSSRFQTGWTCANGLRTEVFFAGSPMHLARHPNLGASGVWQWLRQGTTVSHTSFEFGTDDSNGGAAVRVDLRWASERALWAHGFWSWDWADEYVPVAAVTPKQNGTVQLIGAPKYGLRAGSRYLLLNALSLLDAPAEYFIARNGTLFLIPPDGSDPRTAGSTQVFMSQRLHAHSLNGTSRVVLRGLRLEYAVGAALIVSNASAVTVSNCTLANSGTYGLSLTGQNITVERSKIFGVGCDGLRMSGGDAVMLSPGRVNVSGNHIYGFARVSRTIRPGISWSGCGNTVSSNHIHDAPHSGIMISPPSDGVVLGCWLMVAANLSKCIITLAGQGVSTVFADNYLHDLCQGSADAGGFYVGDSWANRGNVLRGNRFERLYPVEKMSQATANNGVYLDTLEAGWVVEDNIFSSMEVGVFIAGGRQNTVIGNRFINCTTPVVLDSVGLTFKCGPAGQCLDAPLSQQCGCPANYRKELQNVFHYLSPPWSQTFPNISTNMLEGGKSPPVLNTVRNNKWCPRRVTPAPLHRNYSCAKCPKSHAFPFEPTPHYGSFCCTKPTVNKACVGGSICCLLPGSHLKTKFGSDGCQGIARCGNNHANRTACVAPSPPPVFTTYYLETAAKPVWKNTFQHNRLDCSLVEDVLASPAL